MNREGSGWLVHTKPNVTIKIPDVKATRDVVFDEAATFLNAPQYELENENGYDIIEAAEVADFFAIKLTDKHQCAEMPITLANEPQPEIVISDDGVKWPEPVF